MSRFAVYLNSGKVEVFTAEFVEYDNGCILLFSLGNKDKVLEAFFPPDIVTYVKRFSDIAAPAAPNTPGVVEPPIPSGDPLSYTLGQAATVLGLNADTLRARCKSGYYMHAWKNHNSGTKGAAPWMIPLADLGLEPPALVPSGGGDFANT